MSVILTAHLFHGIGKSTLNQVEDLAQKKSCAAGTFLFHAGDRADHLYLFWTKAGSGCAPAMVATLRL